MVAHFFPVALRTISDVSVLVNPSAVDCQPAGDSHIRGSVSPHRLFVRPALCGPNWGPSSRSPVNIWVY